MKILVTGASGYIGERLVSRASSLGHKVIAASRGLPDGGLVWVPFDICSRSEVVWPEHIDAVIHLAAATDSNTVGSAVELEAARRVIAATQKAGGRVVFVSSQAASEDAPTAYGRTKWQIERQMLAAGGWVVRVGQVYGGPERGLFGVLVGLVRASPVIPAFHPAPKVQPVHVDDLVEFLLKCVGTNRVPSSVLCIGAAEPLSFTDFLRAIARNRVRRFRIAIPVPVALLRFASAVAGEHLRTRLGLGRLMSLFGLSVMETERDLQLMRVALRPLMSGMTRSGDYRRYCLIREGRSLLKYVLKAEPGRGLIRRYVRSIECMRGKQPMHLPEWALRMPVANALLDDSDVLSTQFGEEFVWRLNAAVVIAEASIQGARRFLRIGERNGIIVNLAHITVAIVCELWWRVLKMVAAPVLRSTLRNSVLSR